MTCWKSLWQRHFLDFGTVCTNVGFGGNVPKNATISTHSHSERTSARGLAELRRAAEIAAFSISTGKQLRRNAPFRGHDRMYGRVFLGG